MWGGRAGSPGLRGAARALSLRTLELQSLIMDAFHDKGFQKIEEYLQQKEGHLPQKYNLHLLYHLDRLIHKELDGSEFPNVSLLLKCIQIFFEDDLEEEEEPLLIQQGLIQKINSWLEKMTEFLTIRNLTSDTQLTSAIEDLFDSVLIISRRSRKATIQMLDSFIFSLGFLVTEDTVNYLIGQEALSTLNCILDVIPWEERQKLSLEERPRFLMKEFARTIKTVGDYNQQIATSEALCRMATKTTREELVQQWFHDEVLVEAFKKIKNQEFETDCRKFLNLLNNRLGEQRRVYTLPCIAAFAEACEMRKPADDNLEEFWVDFNLGSCSITFYIDNAETFLWEPVKICKEAVVNFSITENKMVKILSVVLGQPVVISKREVRRVELHFDLRVNVLLASIGALGGDKQTLPDQMKMSSQLIRTFEKEDSEISSSPGRQTGKMEESTIPEGFMGAEDDHCLITLHLNDQCEPPPTKAAACSGTRKAYVTSKREYSSNPVECQAPQLDDISRAQSAFEGNGKEEKRVLFNSRKHVFSESDPDSSSSTSSKSWIVTHKRKSLKSYSRRRKLRVSSLKILPLSPVSSFSPKEDHAEHRWEAISRQSSTPASVFSGTNLQEMSDGNSATPKQSRLEEGASGFPILADNSAASLEDTTENLCGSALTTAFENFTRKLKIKYQEKSPLHSEKAKQAPDFLIKLWEQIRLCRLNKLEKFHTSVLQELRNLENDMQALKNLEKDTMEFWEKGSTNM